MEKGAEIHLTIEEGEAAEIEIVVDNDSSQKSTILIGSLKTNRPFNSYTLNSTMKGAWRVRKGYHFGEISANLFSFQFSDVQENERILKNGPWSFDRALLILKEPGLIQPSKMVFDETPFWIRLYYLPLTAISRDIAIKLGGIFGKVLEVDENTISICGKFIRVRVMIDVSKALRRGVLITIGGKKLWIGLKYERLPNFSYTCGKLGHGDLDPRKRSNTTMNMVIGLELPR